MQHVESGEMPNPFALHVDGGAAPGKTAFKTAGKFFLLVAIMLGAVVAIGNYSRTWIADRLASDFDSLSVGEKQTRLVQLSELGIPGLDCITAALADPKDEVAQTAYELLRESQNSWTALDWSSATVRHRALVQAMNTVADQIPDDRTGLTISLLRQIIMESVEKRDPASVELYDLATESLARLSLSNSAGPSVLSDEPLDPREPIRIAVRSKPLPVSEADALEAWTDWPISENRLTSSESSQPVVNPTPSASAPQTEQSPPPAEPSVYRSSSSSKLRPLAESDTVVLQDINSVPQQAPTETTIVKRTSINTQTNYLAETPLETYDTASVIHWMGSSQPALRERAKIELARRGFSEYQLQLATHMATSDVASRLEMVDAIGRSAIEDPRPWLAILLTDKDREVRLKTISVMATMNDREMNSRLQMRLSDERDPIVTARIRRVLNLR